MQGKQELQRCSKHQTQQNPPHKTGRVMGAGKISRPKSIQCSYVKKPQFEVARTSHMNITGLQ